MDVADDCEVKEFLETMWCQVQTLEYISCIICLIFFSLSIGAAVINAWESLVTSSGGREKGVGAVDGRLVRYSALYTTHGCRYRNQCYFRLKKLPKCHTNLWAEQPSSREKGEDIRCFCIIFGITGIYPRKALAVPCFCVYVQIATSEIPCPHQPRQF